MICKNCGAALPEGAAFCPNCGQKFDTPEPAPQVENVQPQQEKKAPNDLMIMIFGIAAIALSFLGWHVVGIVLGIVAMVLAKKYTEAGNELIGKAKIGKLLGLVGLILGIVGLVFAVIIIFVWIVIVVIGAVSGGMKDLLTAVSPALIAL